MPPPAQTLLTKKLSRRRPRRVYIRCPHHPVPYFPIHNYLSSVCHRYYTLFQSFLSYQGHFVYSHATIIICPSPDMTEAKPLLSIVIPAHNEEAYLASTLTSVFSQTIPPHLFEVIVVDNASSDKTASIASQFPTRLTREPRHSVALARQKGVQTARGDIVVSADADTVYPPHWLSQISTTFVQHPQIVALVGWVYYNHVPAWVNICMSLVQRLNLWTFR